MKSSTLLPILVFLSIWIQFALTKNGIFDADYADDADFSNRYETVILQDAAPSSKALFLQKEKLVPMKLGGEQFFCYLPTPVSLDKASAKPSKEKDLENVAFSMLQASLEGSCYYRFTGWWIYEYCHNKHVRQFHQEQNKGVTMEFFLGHMTSPAVAATLDPSTKHTIARGKFKLVLDRETPEETYVKTNFALGTVCDLTQKHRETEIRFYCPAEEKVTAVIKQTGQTFAPGQKIHFIESIEEPSSCNYLLKVYTTALCDIEGFKKQESQTNKVKCMSAPWAAPITIEEPHVETSIPTGIQMQQPVAASHFHEAPITQAPQPSAETVKPQPHVQLPEGISETHTDADLMAALKAHLAKKAAEQLEQFEKQSAEQPAKGTQQEATQPKVVRLNFKLDLNKKDPKGVQEELTKLIVDSLTPKGMTEPKEGPTEADTKKEDEDEQ